MDSPKRLALHLAAAAVLSAILPATARADSDFADRTLSLRPLHFAANAGGGFGRDDGGVVGGVVDAAVGLPFLGELGARIGSARENDHFGNLFDPIMHVQGGRSYGNPEVWDRGTFINIDDVFELGTEVRGVIPILDGTNFQLTPGVPVRVHIPTFLRIDTGVWVPMVFEPDYAYAIDIPAQLFFQAGDAFFGPLSGLRFVHPAGDAPSTTEIPAGVAFGYTLAYILDLKVQVRTERINDPDWSRYLGAGVGVGLRIP